jgi:methylmalonyl-CoA mutase, N-terminal domain
MPDFSALESDQRARLEQVRKRRDGAAVAHGLAEIRAAADGIHSLMPPILDAVRSRATLGEISDTLRMAWGTYRPV